ncbi:hypothetical protein EHI8A_022660 [Entamoeba histolytica HM-1:IMSS-B]|uniref:Uncharacterized protein n=6 Tax=Entamoeba histolytica TaxID=5759 RepID=C4M1D7_ENTH1|nr:hypothetical protein EHI_170150 [Entamoeba histolytica HM-1:IMSS]EMD45212.1 Hypothetical protein EHI5A_048750 [Entamoeba histolytica KU27]EMH73655.1 hypothetical protein EHI8A_022660 [Entamoeba histolytica HM-1:IMSS-B]EMS13348.1 hypothetical protein KM1_043640 [Entamoeba histolytica HM-3:IMSS]ENY64114.1 hypothetical protein EHI7A_026680 [Entamoeba histolytica HM-1:IMSS-A]GAT95015.1 hypothetical protein CL6EHI_170150 [Entamoeba histolytica]|eukprot:XP_655975.1 hypothetical protein EHI_170150 [Entamoeba histolytica HM-1:IMSS]
MLLFFAIVVLSNGIITPTTTPVQPNVTSSNNTVPVNNTINNTTTPVNTTKPINPIQMTINKIKKDVASSNKTVKPSEIKEQTKKSLDDLKKKKFEVEAKKIAVAKAEKINEKNKNKERKVRELKQLREKQKKLEGFNKRIQTEQMRDYLKEKEIIKKRYRKQIKQLYSDMTTQTVDYPSKFAKEIKKIIG